MSDQTEKKINVAQTDTYDEYISCNDTIADQFIEMLSGSEYREEFSDFVKSVEKTKDRLQVKHDFASFIVDKLTDELWKKAVQSVETHGAD